MKNFSQTLALLGTVTEVSPDSASFRLECRSGDVFTVNAGVTTSFSVLQNLDGLNRDRVPVPDGYDSNRPGDQVRRYIQLNNMVAVTGIYRENDEQKRFDAREVTLMHADQGQFLFEDTHWWLTQIARMADEWLDDLFKDRRTYEWDDFAALYRTNLNILGQATDDNIQECATLSRLIYGLSSAYLLTGSERYLLAARAGVKYQRETFRSLSHDGKYCFWMFGKRRRESGAQMIVPSENPDDFNTIPLYEQIYALAGLAQFYRITQDWEVIEDIRRTVAAFQDFYRDDPRFGYGGRGGWFSHLDYATMRPDVAALGNNRMRKNWNSVGDHIPAYLVNVVLALDPLPRGGPGAEAAEELLRTCREIMDEATTLIMDKFPDPASPYVLERFMEDWTPDLTWGWQQNRAIVGHNCKISWNLTRASFYYRTLAQRARTKEERDRHTAHADRMMEVAEKLGDAMEKHGVDAVRGGLFDAVERNPGPDFPIEFTWGNTKDFWQQEQAILAYLIMHGATGKDDYLRLAREMMAFWNLYFLDHDRRGVYFRVTENGNPVIRGAYSQKGGHAVAGYHSFELNYLAHVYIRSYSHAKGSVETPTGETAFDVVDENFCLFFRPQRECGHTTLNVLPDFVPPGALRVASIKVNGVPRTSFNPESFQVELTEEDLGSQVVVEFCPVGTR